MKLVSFLLLSLIFEAGFVCGWVLKPKPEPEIQPLQFQITQPTLRPVPSLPETIII